MLSLLAPEIIKLDTETSHELRRGQIITKISDVVRELVDNSIDAGAKKIQVFLDDFGLEKIEVRDDGHGISKDDISKIVSGGYTSKLLNEEHISRTEDNYGFRGEALSSICSFATVTFFTKTSADTFGTKFGFNALGKLVEESRGPMAGKSGTHVIVKNLFAKYPVRRNYIKEKSRQISDLKEIENYIRSTGLGNPNVSISLAHNGCTIISKPSVSTTEQALVSILGINISKQMKKLGPVDGKSFTIELFVPKPPVDLKQMAMTSNKMSFIFVNRKRVRIKEFETILQHQVLGSIQGTRKHPYSVLNLKVPYTDVDFNRETDKSKVFLVNKDEISTKLESLLQEFYKVEDVGSKELLDFPIQEPDSGHMNNSIVIEAVDILPPAKKSQRNENVMSFLSDIPAVNNCNFTQSPTKTPSFARPSYGSTSVCSTPTGTTKFQSNSKYNTPTSSTPSTSSTPTCTKILDFSTTPGPAPQSSTPSPNTQELQLQRDWVYGQLKDPYGGFIQSTTLLTRSETTSNSGYKQSASTSSNSSKLYDCNSYTTRIRSGFENDNGPPPKRPKSDNGYSNFRKPDYSPSSNRLFSYDTTIPSSQSSSSSSVRGSRPRQVTLDSLKCWQSPGDKLAKSNVIHSSPTSTARSQITNTSKDVIDESEVLICASVDRRTQGVGIPNSSFKEWTSDIISGETTSTKPQNRMVMEPLEMTFKDIEQRNSNFNQSPDRNVLLEPDSLESSSCSFTFKVPVPPRKIEFAKSFSSSSTNTTNTKDHSKAELKISNHNSTLGLSKSISSYEMIRPPREQITQTQSDTDDSFVITKVIYRLPNSTIYIVKVNSILGVFNPLKLLELEPELKGQIEINSSQDEGDDILSDESVAILLEKFPYLSPDDYSEEMVASIFHRIGDIDDPEPGKEENDFSQSQTQEDYNII